MRAVLKWSTVALYLGSIVVANQAIVKWGAAAVPYVTLGLGFCTLGVRDLLHDLFGSHRRVKMATLILVGAGLSYLVNADAALVAKGSAAAFFASETVDALTYHGLRDRPWLKRSNTSNIVGAAIDSIVFVSIVFGFTWTLVLIQTACKVLGGLAFALVFDGSWRPAPARA